MDECFSKNGLQSGASLRDVPISPQLNKFGGAETRLSSCWRSFGALNYVSISGAAATDKRKADNEASFTGMG